MKKPSLTTQIAIALILAVVAGILLQGSPDFVNGYIKPLGTIFLNLLNSSSSRWCCCPSYLVSSP